MLRRVSHITFQCPVSEDLVASFSVAGKTFSSDPRLLAERNSQNAPPNKPSLSTFYFFSSSAFQVLSCIFLQFCIFVVLCFRICVFIVCIFSFFFFIFLFFVFVLAQHSSLNVPPNQLRLWWFYPPTLTILEMKIFLIDWVFTLKVLDLVIPSHPWHTLTWHVLPTISPNQRLVVPKF